MSDELKTTTQEEEVTAQTDSTPVETAAPDSVTRETVAETEESVATEAAAPEAAAPATIAEESATPPASKPAGTVSLRDHSDADDDDSDDDDFDDDFDDDDDAGADEDDSNYVAGPAEYVQREKSGRARRIGSDIRVGDIDYKNIPMLSRFLDRRGRILSRRKTKVNARVQRAIVKAIKRARHLALLPYTGDHTRVVQKRGR